MPHSRLSESTKIPIQSKYKKEPDVPKISRKNSGRHKKIEEQKQPTPQKTRREKATDVTKKFGEQQQPTPQKIQRTKAADATKKFGEQQPPTSQKKSENKSRRHHKKFGEKKQPTSPREKGASAKTLLLINAKMRIRNPLRTRIFIIFLFKLQTIDCKNLQNQRIP